eukprot:CAMPEP_0168564062 /NCGR_PEP_ID=MMETSP0413-20121227/13027_1 /TAXON_ID=136452 /ORGANISM="Filamoeba nolandi, Strain NC-AS-23-1" /LENGTH=132 /DNA_ID=CAMNT_0008595673 /DNA_START=46 /DNA_END=444 /DNA_ORIENTATION=+
MDKCGRCGKTVYPTEKVTAIGKSWHKACFRCKTCSTAIQLGTEQQHEGEIYCKRCHGANFGIGGYGYGGSGGTLASHKYEQIGKTGPSVSNTESKPSNNNAVGSTAVSAKYCSSCGEPNKGGKFCSGCGKAY